LYAHAQPNPGSDAGFDSDVDINPLVRAAADRHQHPSRSNRNFNAHSLAGAECSS
jgi:hypothetical protein